MTGPSGVTGPPLDLPCPVPDDDVDVPRDVVALAQRLNLLGGVGSPGAPGSPLIQRPVLDVGVQGQVRAGRQLTVADFTAMGLSAPLGLWNLGDLTDASGNGRALTNKGSVPFGVGINGQASSAAVFAGSTGQALFIADTGAGDPFRIRTGSWGCWLRTAKRGLLQAVLAKYGATAAVSGLHLRITAANVAEALISDGASAPTATGVSDVADDRWHLVVATHDGTMLRTYVDGVLEAVATASPLNANASAPLNIGGQGADAATATTAPHYGRVDEAFICADVLTDDQVRNLYCASVPHTLAAVPARAALNVTRRRRGAALAPLDLPAPPVRLHNFTAGALGDEGSGGVPVTANPGTGSIVSVAGADGVVGGAYSFAGAHTGLSATDAGLPAATAARSYGCWFKTTALATQTIMGWGAAVGSTDVRPTVQNNGALLSINGADQIVGPFVADGQWHLLAVVEDSAAGDGVRRKLFLDGRCVGGSTVLNSITLGGANSFRVGADRGGGAPFIGQIDGAFVHAGALTAEQVRVLYDKAGQALTPSPKEVGAHVEVMDAARVLFVADTLDSHWAVALGIGA